MSRLHTPSGLYLPDRHSCRPSGVALPPGNGLYHPRQSEGNGSHYTDPGQFVLPFQSLMRVARRELDEYAKRTCRTFHTEAHMLEAAKFAYWLALYNRCSPEEIQIVFVSVWLHDAGHDDDGDCPNEESNKQTSQFLNAVQALGHAPNKEVWAVLLTLAGLSPVLKHSNLTHYQIAQIEEIIKDNIISTTFGGQINTKLGAICAFADVGCRIVLPGFDAWILETFAVFKEMPSMIPEKFEHFVAGRIFFLNEVLRRMTWTDPTGINHIQIPPYMYEELMRKMHVLQNIQDFPGVRFKLEKLFEKLSDTRQIYLARN